MPAHPASVGISRRAFRLAGWLLMSWVVLAGAGCGPKYLLTELDTTHHWRHVVLPKPKEKLDNSLRILTWRDHLDPEILKNFEDRYGVRITVKLITRNEDIYAAMKDENGPTYDLVMPSTYMVQRLIREGKLRPYNRERIPNFRFIDQDYFQLKFDPELKYSVPVFHVTAGLAFNVQYAGGLPVTWHEFAKQMENSLARGRLAGLDHSRAMLGLSLLMNGASPNTTSLAEITKARDSLLDIKSVMDLRITNQNMSKVLEYEDAILAACWSGDAGWAQVGNGYVRFVVPSGQAICDIFSLCIPANAPHPKTAEFFLNYLLTPQIFGALSNNSYYANTSSASRAFIDAALLNGPSYMLPMRSKIVFFEDLGPEISAAYTDAWNAVKSAPTPTLTKLPLPFPRTHSSSVKAHEDYYEER